MIRPKTCRADSIFIQKAREYRSAEPEKNSAGASHEPEKELVSEPIDFGGTGNSDTVNDYLREAQRYSTLDAKSILEQRVQEENELEEKAQRINEEHFRKQQEKEEAERLAREEEERRLAAEKAERERQEAEERARKLEEERRAREEAERLEAERLERERIEREKREAEERERLERERIEREKREAEERERLEQERIEREKREAEERERLEQERIEREKREAEERERLEREKKERDRLEVQRLAKEEEKRLERERLEAEKRAKDEKLARAKELVEAQRIAEEERIARAEELRKSEERILAEERRKAEQKARIEAIAKAKEQARIDKLERAERAAKEREQARLDRLERMEEAARAKEQARREKIERAEREKKEREELRARKIAESAEQMKERERQRIEKEKRAAEIAKAKEAVKAKKREEMAARAEANEKENARYSKYERDIFGLGIIRRKLIRDANILFSQFRLRNMPQTRDLVYERNLDRGAAFSETAGGKATTIEPKMDTMSSFIMDNVFSDQTASIEQGESETWISEPILEGGKQIHPVRSTDENAGEDGKINARSVTEAVKLIKQRAASDFNLRKDAPDISYDREGRDNEPDGFFKDKKESYKLKKQMKMERRDLLYSTVAAIAAELVMIWLALGQRIQGVLPEAITASNHPISYVLVALVVFVVVMVASRFTLISGYNEICNRRPNIDSAVLVGSVATLIHTLFLFFNGRGVSDGTIPQYTAVAGLLLAMNTLGKYCFVSRTIKNFNFLCGTRDQYSFIHINDENGAIKMGDGIVTDEPVIGYPVKINGGVRLYKDGQERVSERETYKEDDSLFLGSGSACRLYFDVYADELYAGIFSDYSDALRRRTCKHSSHSQYPAAENCKKGEVKGLHNLRIRLDKAQHGHERRDN